MATENNTTLTSKLEFDVQMTCESCATAIRNSLSNIGVQNADINVTQQKVFVNSQLPVIDILGAIENTGRRAVLKGFGTSETPSLGNAVAEMLGKGVIGIVRFIQGDENYCLIDGTIDGLSPGDHGLHIHEFGDLTKGCGGLGSHYNPNYVAHGGPNDKIRHIGDLGNIKANKEGRATFRFVNDSVKVWDIIGRSLSVSFNKDDYGKGRNDVSKVDGNCGDSIACAIIARSAGLFQNPKRICACDGISIWDERDNPLAGESRGKAKGISDVKNL